MYLFIQMHIALVQISVYIWYQIIYYSASYTVPGSLLCFLYCSFAYRAVIRSNNKLIVPIQGIYLLMGNKQQNFGYTVCFGYTYS